MDNYELAHDEDGWRLKKQKADRAIKRFDTKSEGMDFSKDFMKAHGGSLKIKKENGRIQEERTYPRGADPRKSKG